MNSTDGSASPVVEVPTYRGRGIQGWRIAFDGELQEIVVVEAGRPFGGVWPERQVWAIVNGQGESRWSEPFRRVRVTAGNRYRFEPGERRLIVAETTMRILIARSDEVFGRKHDRL